ncbi:hypothetical protein JCM8097_003299 [Rhodosporidiobolus ruineniae]
MVHRQLLKDKLPASVFALIGVASVLTDLGLLYPVDWPLIWPRALVLLIIALVNVEVLATFMHDGPVPHVQVPAAVSLFLVFVVGSIRLILGDNHLQGQKNLFVGFAFLLIFGTGAAAIVGSHRVYAPGGIALTGSNSSNGNDLDLEAGLGDADARPLLTQETREQNTRAATPPGYQSVPNHSTPTDVKA